MTRPSVTGLRVRAVNAPLAKPHVTAAGTLDVAPLVLLDLITDAGITGVGYVFVYTPLALRPVAQLLENLGDLVVGQPLDPRAITAMLQARFRLLGNQGLSGICVAAIDMAAWDADAKLAELSLAHHLGSAPTPIRVYDSLGQMSPADTARKVEASLKRGFNAFKIKAGHTEPETDVAVVRAIRDVAGPDTWVAADFNQAFSAEQAIARMALLDAENLAWIEEPVLAEDYAGHASVRAAISTPVQTGENWWGVSDMSKAIEAGASDLVMPDAMKIGGVSGWMAASELATRHDLAVSSHLFAEVSAHLLAATPRAHMLEWLDVSSAINETPLIAPHDILQDGCVCARDEPGAGIVWNQNAVNRYAA